MTFDRVFLLVSYAAVSCGFLALWISGTFGLVAACLFIIVFAAAWRLERSAWQIRERPGTALIVLSLPLYYIAWRSGFIYTNTTATALPSLLALLILTLTAIKLLQKKSDRDWVFLYLMAFFQMLLTAGLSISSLYLVIFIAYIFAMVSAVVLLEIRRAARKVSKESKGRLLNKNAEASMETFQLRKVPFVSAALIFFIVLFAVPMFFLLPRVGGAGVGGGGQAAVATYAGFSDTVKLGEIGRIQESDEVVMRVRLETKAMDRSAIRWRGVALDRFDNFSWSKSSSGKEPRIRGERELIQVDYATGRDSLALQTVYLEPLDSPVLFAMPRPVGIQGNFQMLFRDAYGSISVPRSSERISYRALSDIYTPSVGALRSDRQSYEQDESNYLELPSHIDPRIARLAEEITSITKNRYDAAAAVETYLQNGFGYTLEQRSGGAQPLADFLFNVREGHCEYFSTAMAVMLRTQGIATRVVNGFQRGEYNETADVFVVRRRNAHSWVEVYFPGEDVWVTFDPTPLAGREGATASTGITESFNQYMQALETFWIQYFVAFDNQEQRSLFASVRRGMAEAGSRGSASLDSVQSQLAEWWRRASGEAGWEPRMQALGWAAAYSIGGVLAVFIAFLAVRTLRRLRWLERMVAWMSSGRRSSVVEFYARMQTVLANRGIRRSAAQTPLEFALAVGMPEAVLITQKYNHVRFGGNDLSPSDSAQIESWLERLEKNLAADDSMPVYSNGR